MVSNLSSKFNDETKDTYIYTINKISRKRSSGYYILADNFLIVFVNPKFIIMYST